MICSYEKWREGRVVPTEIRDLSIDLVLTIRSRYLGKRGMNGSADLNRVWSRYYAWSTRYPIMPYCKCDNCEAKRVYDAMGVGASVEMDLGLVPK